MFTKGQKVHHIASWDHGATAYVRECIVYSCGKKLMVLNDAHTGVCVGRNFRPTEFQYQTDLTAGVVIADLTAEQATAKGLELATAYRANRIETIHRMIAASTSAGYIAAVNKELAKLEAATPAVVTPYAKAAA